MAEDNQKTARVVFQNQDTLQVIRGANDGHVRLVQKRTGAHLTIRGDECVMSGEPFAVDLAEHVMTQLYAVARKGYPVYKSDVARAIEILSRDMSTKLESVWLDTVLISGTKARIAPKNVGQKVYVDAMRRDDIVFGVGPAGTGKTYLAMAMAVAAMQKNTYKRIVLTRPAVEAGERLGFLPGDLAEKVNPYLRPLYDALNDMMDVDRARRMIDKGVVEVAPLAFMRGRTLNDSFVILDEAQNATIEQMKMFLTRIGFNSKAVITGDVTQTDLEGRQSGLAHALNVLDGVDGISIVHFTERDVVRHPLVQKIIVAYERAEQRARRRESDSSGDQRGGRGPAGER